MRKIVLDSRPPLVKNLLFAEGFTRGGKLLLANIINGFDGVEPVQYHGLLEYLPFLENFKLIDTKTAQEIIRCEIDTHCYEMLIGRNFNYRKYDASSIYHIPRYKNYLKRSAEKDRDKNLHKFYKDNSYSFFMMHELIPNIKIYFDIFPHLKIISIKRNPIDVIYSWYKRNLLKRFGQDPEMFAFPLKSQAGPIPWYAYQSRVNYHRLSEIDQTILSIRNLFGMYKKSYSQLPRHFKNKILFVSFEDLVFNKTDKVIKRMGRFLGKKPLAEMSSILEREDVPRNGVHSKTCRALKEKLMCTECKFKQIKKMASKKYFDMLMKLKEDYETGKTYAYNEQEN